MPLFLYISVPGALAILQGRFVIGHLLLVSHTAILVQFLTRVFTFTRGMYFNSQASTVPGFIPSPPPFPLVEGGVLLTLLCLNYLLFVRPLRK